MMGLEALHDILSQDNTSVADGAAESLGKCLWQGHSVEVLPACVLRGFQLAIQ